VRCDGRNGRADSLVLNQQGKLPNWPQRNRV
jgi:hypothetical protein